MLTLFTLTMAGAIFIAVFNVRITLHDYVDRIGRYFLADVTLDFDRPYRLNEIISKAARSLVWFRLKAGHMRVLKCSIRMVRLADNMTILAPPGGSQMVAPMLIAGRWIQPGDEKAFGCE